jgi:hypothetical protein
MNNNPTLTIPSLLGTLAKRSMPTLQPNFAKEPFSPSRSNSKTAAPQKIKKGASVILKCLKMNNAQNTTMAIINRRDSIKIKACSSFQIHRKLKELSFEIAYFSQPNRYCPIVKNKT